MKTLFAYLRLSRPANIVTAVADIFAGYSVLLFQTHDDSLSGINFHSLIFLIPATIGLYGGGVVMNDVADYSIDKIERPERPIPSGFASRGGAAAFGIALLLAGIISAWHVSSVSGIIALVIACLALIYDFKGKHHIFLGPINMGLCRGGNLLLGMSASVTALNDFYLIAIIPVIYIAAITMISRGEVAGGNKSAIRYASLMYGLVAGAIAFLSIITKNNFIPSLVFIALFTLIIYRPLIVAWQNPEPLKIRAAVKTGVIALIVMDAAIATCFAGWMYGLYVLILLPVSILLAKVFAVT